MKKAQSVLEYAMIIMVVVAALMAMNVYVQRSVQGNLKSIEGVISAEPVESSWPNQQNTSPTPTAPPSSPILIPEDAKLYPYEYGAVVSTLDGQDLHYYIDIPENSTGLSFDIIAMDSNCSGTVTLTFSDGTALSKFPNGRDFDYGVSDVGLSILLRSQKNPLQPNFAADYFPSGRALLTIHPKNSVNNYGTRVGRIALQQVPGVE